VAGRNGYPNSGTSGVVVSVGAKPTQLVVTISSTIHNSFGAGIGKDWANITRSATADYNGPAPMRSPCNAFGNEPPGAVSDLTDPLRGTPSSGIVAPAGGGVVHVGPTVLGCDRRPGDRQAER